MFQNLFGGDPQSQGSLAAISQILQASGPSLTPRGLYQILGSGMAAGQEATQQAQQLGQQSQLRDLQIKGAENDLANERAAQEQAQKLKSFWSSRGAGSPPPGAMTLPGMGSQSVPTSATQSAALPTTVPSGGNMTPNWFEKQMGLVEELYANGFIAEAQAREKQALAFRGKAKWENGKKNGKVVPIPLFDDGTQGPAADVEVAQNLNWQDIGPETIGSDPTFGNVVVRQKNGVSPNTAVANSTARDNLALSRERLALDRERLERTTGAGGAIGAGQKPPAGYRWTANGGLEAIPGGPATKNATATEGERKAATLMQRLQFSESQLEAALVDSPGAATPSLLAQGLRGIGAEAAANTSTSEARQKVDAAQLDILDAALTLGTGAAYTKEQLEGYRKSYFPQIGDAEGTVADKQARLKNVIDAAKIAAGRAAPGAQAKPQQAAASIPQTAANYLKMNPKYRAEFDAKYGPGAAASILGK